MSIEELEVSGIPDWGSTIWRSKNILGDKIYNYKTWRISRGCIEG